MHYCGPTVLQMILGAYGIVRTQRSLGKEAKSHVEYGTKIKDMAAVLRSYDFEVSEKNNRRIADLQQAHASGKLIIVCYAERFWKWDHYAIIKKMGSKHIYLIDPQEKIGTTLKMSLKEFDKVWYGKLFTHTKRWALFADEPKK